MDRTEIAKQLELYSNAIVAFTVFQGLAFCYNFATSREFNLTVKTTMSLSVGLTFLFLVTMILGLFANHFIRFKLEKLSEEYSQLVKSIYLGKSIVIGLFGSLPMIITVCYAIFLI